MRAPIKPGRRPLAAMLAIGLATGLMGCASVTKDAGFAEVRESVSERTGLRVHWNQGSAEDAEVSEQIRVLLAKPLNADAVVQIALLNNPALQATYEELGIAQANLVQAGLLRNPVFHGEIRYPREEDHTNLDLGVSLDFLNVFTIPLRRRIARAQYAQAKLRVTGEVMDLAGEVREAFLRAQAATQTAEMMQQVVRSSAAAAYAARRLREAGNITELRLANQQVLHQETRQMLAVAEGEVMAARERLNVLSGLWGPDTAWRIDSRLPPLPAQEVDVADVEKRAVETSLELESQRLRLESIAKRLGVTKNTRLVPELEAGYVFERDDGEKEDGVSFGLQIPLFDFGQARVAVGDAELRRAQREYLAQAIEVRSAARLARENLRLARARSEHTQKVLLPLSQRIVADTLLQYNAMQLGVFQLLQAQERQIALGRRLINDLRDYWIAQAQLEQLLNGRLPRGGMAIASEVAVPTGAAGAGGH